MTTLVAAEAALEAAGQAAEKGMLPIKGMLPMCIFCDKRLGLLLTRLGCLQVTPGRRRCCSWHRTSLMLRAGSPTLCCITNLICSVNSGVGG